MQLSKCKNSVFCIYFFVFYILGTICGIFSYRLIIGHDAAFVRYYSCEVSDSLLKSVARSAITALRPLLIVIGLSQLPFGQRFIFLYVVIRGFMTSYAVAALWIGECDLCIIILRGLILLPAFYGICKWSYCSASS